MVKAKLAKSNREMPDNCSEEVQKTRKYKSNATSKLNIMDDEQIEDTTEAIQNRKKYIALELPLLVEETARDETKSRLLRQTY